MDIDSYLQSLPPGGQSQMAKRLGIAPAYLYQMVKGIRPISAERVIAICESTDWHVTPHELRPDIYPNEADGIPPGKSRGSRVA